MDRIKVAMMNVPFRDKKGMSLKLVVRAGGLVFQKEQFSRYENIDDVISALERNTETDLIGNIFNQVKPPSIKPARRIPTGLSSVHRGQHRVLHSHHHSDDFHLSFRSKVKRKYDRGSSVTDFFLVISIISIWIAVLESIIIMAGPSCSFINKTGRSW